MRKRGFGWVIVLAILVIAGYFYVRSTQQRSAEAASRYQTTAIERGSLTSIVGATGRVRTNQTAQLAWQTTGLVESVPFAVGDQVEEGDLLAELRRGSLNQNIILAEAELVSARQALEDLQDYELRAAQAQVNLANAVDALDKAEKARTSKDYSRSSDETLETARANYLLTEKEVEKAEEIFEIFENRAENDTDRLNALSALMAARQVRDRALANYNYLQSKPNEEEINKADADLAFAQAQLQTAQAEYERIKDGPSEEDISAAEARIEAAEATLALARLEAPISGTLTSVSIKPGDQVAPGQAAFRIDDLSRLLVDVQVPEVDVNLIRPDQSARVSFDAISGKDYTGRVIEVGQVANVDNQGIVNFPVTVELQDADEQVRPGMTAAVNIVIQQLDDVLIVPNRAVRLQEGQPVVYLLRGDTPSPVRIDIGARSDTHSEVLGGEVKAGDVVVLNPPVEMFGPFGR